LHHGDKAALETVTFVAHVTETFVGARACLDTNSVGIARVRVLAARIEFHTFDAIHEVAFFACALELTRSSKFCANSMVVTRVGRARVDFFTHVRILLACLETRLAQASKGTRASLDTACIGITRVACTGVDLFTCDAVAFEALVAGTDVLARADFTTRGLRVTRIRSTAIDFHAILATSKIARHTGACVLAGACTCTDTIGTARRFTAGVHGDALLAVAGEASGASASISTRASLDAEGVRVTRIRCTAIDFFAFDTVTIVASHA